MEMSEDVAPGAERAGVLCGDEFCEEYVASQDSDARGNSPSRRCGTLAAEREVTMGDASDEATQPGDRCVVAAAENAPCVSSAPVLCMHPGNGRFPTADSSQGAHAAEHASGSGGDDTRRALVPDACAAADGDAPISALAPTVHKGPAAAQMTAARAHAASACGAPTLHAVVGDRASIAAPGAPSHAQKSAPRGICAAAKSIVRNSGCSRPSPLSSAPPTAAGGGGVCPRGQRDGSGAPGGDAERRPATPGGELANSLAESPRNPSSRELDQGVPELIGGSSAPHASGSVGEYDRVSEGSEAADKRDGRECDKAFSGESLSKDGKKKASGFSTSLSSSRSSSVAAPSRGGDAGAKKRKGAGDAASLPRAGGVRRPSLSKSRRSGVVASGSSRRDRDEEDYASLYYALPGQVKKKMKRTAGDALGVPAFASPRLQTTPSPFRRLASKKVASASCLLARKYEESSPYAGGDHASHSHHYYHWLAASHASGGSGAHSGLAGGGGLGPAGGGRSGGLSEKVRKLVEQTMSEKHRVVWIERGEAKGFLPLPGMQEERVYLVWTEKGIDILADVQAYIPWTHCPVLMPTKYRRNQIPFLVLSSTSVALLFSHVCRRSATAVYRLPLPRTPQAYRKHVLNLLRTEEPEKPASQPSKSQRRRSPCSSPSPNGRSKLASAPAEAKSPSEDAGSTAEPKPSPAPSPHSGTSPSASSSRPFRLSAASPQEATADAAAPAVPVSSPDQGGGRPPLKSEGGAASPPAFFLPSALTTAASLSSSLGSASPTPTEGPLLESAGSGEKESEKPDLSMPRPSPDAREPVKAQTGPDGEGPQGTPTAGAKEKKPEGEAAKAEEDSAARVKAELQGDQPSTGEAPKETKDREMQREGEGPPPRSSSAPTSQLSPKSTATAAASSPPSSRMARGGGAGRAQRGGQGASKEGERDAAESGTPGEEVADDEDLFWANGGKKGFPLTAVDMRDFYCCSQGKVIGEDYVYFRQYLPDDEGADIYDLHVSIRKRPKKLLLKKPRVPSSSASFSAGAGAQKRLEESDAPLASSPGDLSSAFAASSPDLASSGSSGVAAGGDSLLEDTLAHGGAGAAPEGGEGGGSKVDSGAATAAPDASKASPAQLLRLLMAPNPGGAVEAGEKEAKEEGGDSGSSATWKNWTYVDDYGEDGMDAALKLPFSFTSEVRVLLGLATSPTPHRCNMSLASHRVAGAVQRKIRMYQCSADGETRGEQVDPFEPEAPSSRVSTSGDDGDEEREDAETAKDGEEKAGKGDASEAEIAAARPSGTAEEEAKASAQESPEGAAPPAPSVKQGEQAGAGADVELSSGRDGSEAGEDKRAPEDEAKEAAGAEKGAETGDEDMEREAAEKTDSEEEDDEQQKKRRSETETFAISSHDLPNGSLAEIDYPTEFTQFREADRIRIYDRDFVARALKLIVDVALVSGGADLSAVNLAQYAPNLFWNIIRFSGGNKDIDEVVRTIAPSVASLRSARGRRKRELESSSFATLSSGRLGAAARRGDRSLHDDFLGAGRWVKKNKAADAAAFSLEDWLAGNGDDSRRSAAERAETGVDKAKQREEKRQKELEERFLEMKHEFEEKARNMIARRLALKDEMHSDGKGSKKRVPSLPENDDRALVNLIIDPEQGILKWPLSLMSIRQRNVIYQECLRRDLTACIRLTKVPGKGRAVFAADTILKDDFVVEYKGELCSEREAREREQRYNRSRVPMGSFMFYFKNGSRMMAIDATDEKQDFGPARLINHSRKNPNMTPRAIMFDDLSSEPRLIFVARRNIEKDEELLVDYGERDPDVIKEHPWLNN
ncbi:hypothetical protein BESB_016770 [Besnoitia besnoiti]|uniref:SET domain-containing protein n=1 Tax=Besnoitia besnoiti TaxID=94643 RepID=A0A2A9M345_BESBE|nr:hypothetical protein BESB_016770 [Besnoitia besnoiti]PFH32359.1 hypothetical protein BESB_016770 [Besnoitia besnoiti]